MSERFPTELERELRGVLQRVDPPAGFAGRVMAQVQRRQLLMGAGPRAWRPTAFSMLRRRAAMLSAFAIVLAACASLTILAVRHQRLESQNAQTARAQLLSALQVTTGELDWAEARLDQALAAPAGSPPRPAPRAPREERP